MDKICFEEGFHIKHGESILRELATGSRKEQKLVQEAFEEWWPRILQFFGPTDDQSTHHDFASAVGLKTMGNDELRQSFLNAYLPKARKYGLELPEYPRINEGENGRYEVVEDDLDWGEFWEIAKNDYEPGRQRIDSRKAAREAVAWVRESMETPGSGSETGSIPQAAD
jgi:ring-1,2-phenylacetyl-CoA epoxidase subunit PaaA